MPHTLQEIDKAFIVAEDAYVRAHIVLRDLIRVAMMDIDSDLLLCMYAYTRSMLRWIIEKRADAIMDGHTVRFGLRISRIDQL